MDSLKPDRYNQNKEGVLLPYRLVEAAYSQGHIRALACFVAMKKVHRNGVFYAPSSRKLGSILGLSHTLISLHIKTLIDLGLVKYQTSKNGDPQLILSGYKKHINRWGKGLVFIKFGPNKEIQESLRSQIAIRNIKEQEYNIRRKQGRNRKLKKSVESAQNYASLSNRNLAKLMGVSISTAYRLKIKWKEQGLIKLNPMWRVLEKESSEQNFRRLIEAGVIPVYAKYQKTRGRILIRIADAAAIGSDGSYKYGPNSWTPSFTVMRNYRINNKNTVIGGG